jgi:hypothetical protein
MGFTSLENRVENIKVKGGSRSRNRSRTPSRAVNEPSISLPLEVAEKNPQGYCVAFSLLSSLVAKAAEQASILSNSCTLSGVPSAEFPAFATSFSQLC